MSAVPDFEDILTLFARHRVRYLIVGGLAFIYHAKPRYTKDIDLWIAPDDENVSRANQALAEFGSPALLDPGEERQILQIGVAPNRIDLLRFVPGEDFDRVWARRIEGRYGTAPAHWIDLESLATIKEAIDSPRHQEDARILREVLRLRGTPKPE
jgi:hypothetical protein